MFGRPNHSCALFFSILCGVYSPLRGLGPKSRAFGPGPSGPKALLLVVVHYLFIFYSAFGRGVSSGLRPERATRLRVGLRPTRKLVWFFACLRQAASFSWPSPEGRAGRRPGCVGEFFFYLLRPAAAGVSHGLRPWIGRRVIGQLAGLSPFALSCACGAGLCAGDVRLRRTSPAQRAHKGRFAPFVQCNYYGRAKLSSICCGSRRGGAPSTTAANWVVQLVLPVGITCRPAVAHPKLLLPTDARPSEARSCILWGSCRFGWEGGRCKNII